MSKKVVIDASLALKFFPIGNEKLVTQSWFLWEKIVKGEIEAYAPVFLLIEVMNILYKKKKIAAKLLKNIVQRLANSEIVFREFEKWEIHNLMKIVMEYDVTSYDAMYILLAKNIKCKLVTADEKLLRAKDITTKIEEF